MSDPPAVVVREKNPKRVAAGKKAAEKNKMYKEHFEKTREAASATDEKPVTKADDADYTHYFIGVVVLVMGGIAYYQSRPKSEPEAPKPVTSEAPKPPPPKPNRLINM